MFEEDALPFYTTQAINMRGEFRIFHLFFIDMSFSFFHHISFSSYFYFLFLFLIISLMFQTMS